VSALVLSSGEVVRMCKEGGRTGKVEVPMATDLPACRCSSATFTHRSRCGKVSAEHLARRGGTYTFQGVLINPLIVYQHRFLLGLLGRSRLTS